MINIDAAEVAKFSNLADVWWDLDGPAATLHQINPARMQYITQKIALSGKQVLDVGCGAGILTEQLALQGARVTAIDASQELIAAATAHASCSLDITYSHGTLENWPEQKYDCITCLELIEHVPEPENLLAELAKRLAPEGKLFISTINKTAQAFLAAIVAGEYILKLLPKNTHSWEKFIAPHDLELMANTHGLAISNMQGIFYNPLTKDAKLTPNVSVNYICCLEHLY